MFFASNFPKDWAGKVSIGKTYDKEPSDGRWIEQNKLYGIIDEFYLFERALKQNEITLLAQTCNYHRTVLHYGFNLFSGKTVYDQSGLANNGLAINGTTSSNTGTCGKAVNMTMGQIKIPGDSFREKPQKAISISVWISLQTNRYDIDDIENSCCCQRISKTVICLEYFSIILMPSTKLYKNIGLGFFKFPL